MNSETATTASGRRTMASAIFLMLLSLALLIHGCSAKREKDSAAAQTEGSGAATLPQDKASRILSARTLGLAYLEENKLEEARDQFLKLTELAPNEALGYANLGLVYMRMGQLEEAEKQLKKAIELSPDDTDIRLNLVRVYEMAGEKDKASAALQKNAEMVPDDPKTLYALAEAYSGSQDESQRKKREEYLARIIEQKPANLAARLYLIEALLRNEKADPALEHLEQIERLTPEMPKDARAYYDRAMDFLRAQDIRQALTSTIILHNFLKLTNEYQSAIDVLKGERGTDVGAPIITFSQAMPAYAVEGASILEAMRFTDATEAAGLLLVDATQEPQDAVNAHIQAADVDRDTDVDLYLGMRDPESGKYRHFLMQNEMGRFKDITAGSGIDHNGMETGSVFGDYNNDGHLDLYVTQESSGALYFNEDVGSFDDRTRQANIVNAGGECPLFFDYDHDGDIDLYIAGASGNTLFRNNGDGTFTETSGEAGLGGTGGRSTGACFADYDDDGDIDLFVTTSTAGNRLYTNIREGRFRDISSEALPKTVGASGTATTGDYNNDGFPDVFAASIKAGMQTLLKNRGDGTFEADNQERLNTKTAHIKIEAVHFFDFDNDGSLDLLLAGTSQRDSIPGVQLWHNNGSGTFDLTEGILPENTRSASSIAVADYNMDGDLDIFLAGNQGFQLLRNDGGNANRHLKVQLVGVRTGSGKNNYYGIGSKVEMRSGELYQMRTVTSQNVYFGMGQKDKADVVRILWPNGTAQNIFSPGSDQDLVEEQILKGSCPFLYAWNGQKFAFVKDVMWRSALGMPLGIMGGNTTYAFAEASRDYVKIDGKYLQSVNGIYTLQLTGELWETLYIDEVKLFVADHPDSIEIFVNEAFYPPPFHGLEVFSISRSIVPQAAVNHKGRDVKEYISRKDNLYLSDFKHTGYQGITDTTYLVLDPGTVQTDGLLLFLNGWIFPTDASINKAISQGTTHRILPPSIDVVNKNGNWQTVYADLGFPMGKDKTVVVDLSNLYLSENRLLRIRTNQEIYWDHVFFGHRLVNVQPDTTSLTLSGADLHYRGFSKMYRKGGRHGPHWFDYNDVQGGQKWRDLSGWYTRYGDVAPLLRASDNRYIITNAGDEITLTFEGTRPTLPKGWSRDFFIYTVGWVKDGDLNTATGHTVGPLPYHGMERYPYAEASAIQEKTHVQQYQQHYNTRRVTDEEFRNAVRKWKP